MNCLIAPRLAPNSLRQHGACPHHQRREALEVLNLREADATREAVGRQYDKYFAANDIGKGGSFYLQSKVFRAKEALDLDFEEEKKGKRDEKQKE